MNFDTLEVGTKGEDLEQALKRLRSEVAGNENAARMYRENAADLVQRARGLERQAEEADRVAQDRQEQIEALIAKSKESSGGAQPESE